MRADAHREAPDLQLLLGILPRPSRVTEPLLVEPKDVSPRERHQHQTVPVEYHRKLRPVPPPLLAALRPAPRL